MKTTALGENGPRVGRIGLGLMGISAFYTGAGQDDAGGARRPEPARAPEPTPSAESRGNVINDVFADSDEDDDSLFDGDDDFDVPSFLK